LLHIKISRAADKISGHPRIIPTQNSFRTAKMDTNGTSPVPQSRIQPSIRSFFQPRSPNYAPPPGTATRQPKPAIPLVPTSPILQSSPSQAPSSNPALPPQATISQVAEQHIQPLRRINSLLLPIPYPDSFYHAILAPSPAPSFSRIITWTDPSTLEEKVIGGIVCRLEPLPSAADSYQIYIQSLALLSPYRGKGLATAVLNDVISAATKQEALRIESVYGHVWTQNEEGLEWYAKRGFGNEEQVLAGYYRKLKPDSAFVLRRKIQASDHLNSVPTQTEAAPETKRPANPTHARSFQDKGPEMEWNDLPEDVLGNGLLMSNSHLSTPNQGSAASSRSSSRSGGAGKKKRVYPAAAFGS
jgi:N-alpha-acetyltransferase 50